MSFPFARIVTFSRFSFCFLILAASATTQAQTLPPSAEAFFSATLVEDAILSPDGTQVAMQIKKPHTHATLAVMNLTDMQMTDITPFLIGDVTRIHWVNNQRLVFSMDAAIDDDKHLSGFYAVNNDGSHYSILNDPSAHFNNRSELSQKSIAFFSRTRTGNSNVIYAVRPIYSSIWEVSGHYLVKLDTMAGGWEVVKRPDDSDNWIVDDNDTPRATVASSGGKSQFYYRDSATDKWQIAAEFPTIGPQSITPVTISPEGEFFVTARNGGDYVALYRFDTKNRRLEPTPVFSTNGYDFNGELVVDHTHKKILGVHFKTDSWGTKWFDPDMEKIQHVIDDKLPNAMNLLSLGESGPGEHVLVASCADVHPCFYYVFETRSGKLIQLGERSQSIDPKRMAQTDLIHYTARDGLDIPAYLTLPRGRDNKNLPLVVLVHGGPYLRGVEWDWDPEAQFLASRGYAVLQPEYRGSTGFGFRHFQAGWKQWGLAMQDDVTDGTRWMIEQGIANPKRICIAGASYGGYAALMGLAKEKDLYRCGIDWVGVTDMDQLFEYSWEHDMSKEALNYSLPILIGDRSSDSKKFKENSPLYLTDKITQPVLLAYGKLDHRVPLSHGQEFYDKLRKTNDKVEWVVYDDEGHGWFKLKNTVDFWTRVEKFLDDNIGAH